MRVLHVAAEIFPLVKTGGFADVVAALPAALAHANADVRLLLPGMPQMLDAVLHAKPVIDLGACFGAARVRPEGLLLAGSCSAHVGADGFFAAVRTGVRRSGRRFQELRTTAHPPDHPASFPEAHYLKAIYLRLA